MLKKLIAAVFAFAVVLLVLSPVLAQEASKQGEAKESSSEKKAEKGKAAQARWEGVVVRSSPENSTLTVRKKGTAMQKTVHYDSTTQWVAQEHGSKNTVDIQPSQVKDGDRVICLGSEKGGEFRATLISKRLTGSTSPY